MISEYEYNRVCMKHDILLESSRKLLDKSFRDDIIDIIKNTPMIKKEYWCHGEPHSYKINDYEIIRDKIKTLIESILPSQDKRWGGSVNVN